MDTDVTKMEGKRLHTNLLKRWYGVKQRTTPSYWEESPSYAGVKMCPEWRDSFDRFRDDVKSLHGHNFVDGNGSSFEIDKDLFSGKEKRYSLKTCCFLPREVNNFIRDPRGNWRKYPPTVTPLGEGQYLVTFGRGSEIRILGVYSSLKSAYAAYGRAKKDDLDKLTKKWKEHLSPEVVQALGAFEFCKEDILFKEDSEYETCEFFEGVLWEDSDDSSWEYAWEKYCVKNTSFKEILPIS